MEQPEYNKMINGQAEGRISKLRYGLFPMSFNGCEVIAVHNALCFLGKPREITEIARFMERYSVLLGLFGCNVFRVGKGLERFGVSSEKVKSIDGEGSYILSYWTGRRLFSSIHTVFCTCEKGRLTVYNRSNHRCTPAEYGSPEEAFGKYEPIVVYRIKNEEEER